ncbi:MAG: FMN-binding protein, partial [Mobilitalea sp.]
AMLILVGIIAGSFLIERFFCRYLCPLGAYFSIVSRIRPLVIAKNRENCGACSLCTKKCSIGINLSKVDKIKTGECINCMECINNCPKSNAHMELADVNVNAIVAGTASCALVLGAVYLGNYCEERLNISNESLTATVSAQTISENALADGTYEGTGSGFRGETTVNVTVSEGIISEIQIVSTDDDAKYMNKASNQMIADMISTQTAEVDTVSGATYSSNGLIEAVKEALSQAATDNTTTDTTADTTADTTTDIANDTSDTEDNDTSDVEDNDTTDVVDDTGISTDITSSTTSSDTTTGSDSSTGTLASVADGTYEGSGTGFRGETTVSVTVSGGKITDVSILSYQDDQRYFDSASDTVTSEIITNQDVNVDAVSGATYSSNSIIAAVADALSLDYTQPVIESGRGHGRH